MSQGTDAYSYPYRGVPFNLPELRRARAGTRDIGSQAWARRGRRLNMRRPLNFLEGNPRAGGRQVWPLLDSLGRRLAVLEHHSNRWELLDPETGEVLYTDRRLDGDQLEVQGRGCMTSPGLERRHALLAFRPNDPLEDGSGLVPFRLRAFIDRRALPARNSRGQLIRGAVDAFDVGCGGSPLPVSATQPVRDPGFDADDRFLGEDGFARTLATYNAKPAFGGAIYLLANTSGVHGGGIVRGVVRAGDRFGRIDGFSYCDPNVPAGAPERVRWSYGRILGTRMWGWLPERC